MVSVGKTDNVVIICIGSTSKMGISGHANLEVEAPTWSLFY